MTFAFRTSRAAYVLAWAVSSPMPRNVCRAFALSYAMLVALAPAAQAQHQHQNQHHHSGVGPSHNQSFNNGAMIGALGALAAQQQVQQHQGHHHHHHHQQQQGSNGYWSNGTFYYYTTPTVVQSVVPQQVYVAPVPQNYLPAAVAAPVNYAGTITILNPAESGGEVAYSLNGSTYSIKPGYSQVIANDRSWLITFGSGGPRGDVRYTLTNGTFKFKPMTDGWELVRASEQAMVAQNPPAPAPAPPQP
ncbi:MAG TPA: hypothetical protein VGM98_08535 [Schlesneria sp.]